MFFWVQFLQFFNWHFALQTFFTSTYIPNHEREKIKDFAEKHQFGMHFSNHYFVAVNPIRKKGPQARALSNVFVVRLLYSTDFAYVSICLDPPTH